jgi:hypothetical protein
MATARDLITNALHDLGVLAKGVAPSSEDLDDAFTALNQWVTDLETQRASMFTQTREVFALTPGVASYTIGPDGAFATVRPLWIDGASVIDSASPGAVEIPLAVPLTMREYQGIPQKSLQSTRPDRIYYDAGFVGTGQATICVFPVPSSSGVSLVLYLPRPMQRFADPFTNYAFPPGYERMVRSNLAVELAPMFDVEPSPSLHARARESMASVKRANHRVHDMTLDPMFVGLGRYNIYTDSV